MKFAFVFRQSRAEANFSQGHCRPSGIAMSMARRSSVSRACGWLVSAVFWAWIEKEALIFLTVFETKNEIHVHIRFACTCNIFRVRGVIVSMACPIFRREKFAGPTRYAFSVSVKSLLPTPSVSFQHFISLHISALLSEVSFGRGQEFRWHTVILENLVSS